MFSLFFIRRPIFAAVVSIVIVVVGLKAPGAGTELDTLAEATVLLAETAYAGTLNIAGREALSREEYGRKMLAYWAISTEGLVQAGSAAERSDSIPLDLRLSVERAEGMLKVDLAGLTTNLSSHPPGGRGSNRS